MVAVPGAISLTVPPSTVATPVLLLLQETDLSAASCGCTLAVRTLLSPALPVIMVPLSVTPVTSFDWLSLLWPPSTVTLITSLTPSHSA